MYYYCFVGWKQIPKNKTKISLQILAVGSEHNNSENCITF